MQTARELFGPTFKFKDDREGSKTKACGQPLGAGDGNRSAPERTASLMTAQIYLSDICQVSVHHHLGKVHNCSNRKVTGLVVVHCRELRDAKP